MAQYDISDHTMGTVQTILRHNLEDYKQTYSLTEELFTSTGQSHYKDMSAITKTLIDAIEDFLQSTEK